MKIDKYLVLVLNKYFEATNNERERVEYTK